MATLSNQFVSLAEPIESQYSLHIANSLNNFYNTLSDYKSQNLFNEFTLNLDENTIYTENSNIEDIYSKLHPIIGDKLDTFKLQLNVSSKQLFNRNELAEKNSLIDKLNKKIKELENLLKKNEKTKIAEDLSIIHFSKIQNMRIEAPLKLCVNDFDLNINILHNLTIDKSNRQIIFNFNLDKATGDNGKQLVIFNDWFRITNKANPNEIEKYKANSKLVFYDVKEDSNLITPLSIMGLKPLINKYNPNDVYNLDNIDDHYKVSLSNEFKLIFTYDNLTFSYLHY